MRTYDKKHAISIIADVLVNATSAFNAAEQVGIPLAAACAMLHIESHGANRWGNDAGGVFQGFPMPVTEQTFRAFLWEVRVNNRTSNGVGPCQITFKGHFDVMENRLLKAWVPLDNMLYGFGLLWSDYQTHGKTWAKAGQAYNGSPSYGQLLASKVHEWRDRLEPAAI